MDCILVVGGYELLPWLLVGACRLVVFRVGCTVVGIVGWTLGWFGITYFACVFAAGVEARLAR